MQKKYGLVLPSSKGGIQKRPSIAKKPFGEDSDDDNDERRFDESEDEQPVPPPPPMPTAAQRQESQTGSRRFAEIHQKALEDDANIFDYDGVYDQMKEAEQKQKLDKEGVKQARQPRYIKNMLEMAEERARQEIRIQERKIHRELEKEMKENPELAQDREQFVTDAYRKQQQLVKEMEEEERRKLAEEMQDDVTKKKNFVGFYKNLLDARSGKRNLVIPADKQTRPEQAPSDSAQISTTDARDNGDKKELKGGLNILKKPAAYITKTNESAEYQEYLRQLQQKKRQQMRQGDSREIERISRDFEKQLVEHEREEEERRRREQEQIKAKWMRQTDQQTVSDARRRFEERKRQRQQQSQDDE